jgi:hypothetical protein
MQRRNGIIAFAALSSFLLCGATSPTTCNDNAKPIGPSTGEVVGVGIAVAGTIVVATVVLVKVHNSHYNLKGCVTAGPDGLKLHENGNGKSYSLTGVTANVKVGDIIKVHGAKLKHQRDSAGDQDFAVEEIGRDFGPCKAVLAPPPGTAAPGTAASSSAP